MHARVRSQRTTLERSKYISSYTISFFLKSYTIYPYNLRELLKFTNDNIGIAVFSALGSDAKLKAYWCKDIVHMHGKCQFLYLRRNCLVLL